MEQKKLSDEEMEAALPKPVGYKMLVALPQVEETFGNTGIVKANTTIHNETITSVIALVLDMGPEAYKDEVKFPNGPWCKVGDYVLMRPYQGTRFMLNGQEFRIVNDDTVDGVVADPRGYSRV